MSKYDALHDFLQDLPIERTEVKLTFEKIETILGKELPPSARTQRPWWANTTASSHASRWLNSGWKVASVDLVHGTVIFRRTDDIINQGLPRRAIYERLRAFFTHLPSHQEQLALTYSELEEIIGQKLPKTALQDRTWWANTKSSPQGSSWVSAGWRLESIFLVAETAVFRRKGNNPLRSVPRYVKHLLEGSHHQSYPTQLLLKWIRFCRKVGWYFEATILYERGGIPLDSISEVERADVDEHYAVCKLELSRYRNTSIINPSGGMMKVSGHVQE